MFPSEKKSLVFIKLRIGTKDKPFEECFILLNSRSPLLKSRRFILLSYYEVAPLMLFTIGLLQILKILNNLGTSFLNIILVIFTKGPKWVLSSWMPTQLNNLIGISKVRMDIILGSLFQDLPCNRSPFDFESRSLANENVCSFIHSSHSSELNLNGFWYMLSISPAITIRLLSYAEGGPSLVVDTDDGPEWTKHPPPAHNTGRMVCGQETLFSVGFLSYS